MYFTVFYTSDVDKIFMFCFIILLIILILKYLIILLYSFSNNIGNKSPYLF